MYFKKQFLILTLTYSSLAIAMRQPGMVELVCRKTLFGKKTVWAPVETVRKLKVLAGDLENREEVCQEGVEKNILHLDITNYLKNFDLKKPELSFQELIDAVENEKRDPTVKQLIEELELLDFFNAEEAMERHLTMLQTESNHATWLCLFFSKSPCTIASRFTFSEPNPWHDLFKKICEVPSFKKSKLRERLLPFIVYSSREGSKTPWKTLLANFFDQHRRETKEIVATINFLCEPEARIQYTKQLIKQIIIENISDPVQVIKHLPEAFIESSLGSALNLCRTYLKNIATVCLPAAESRQFRMHPLRAPKRNYALIEKNIEKLSDKQTFLLIMLMLKESPIPLKEMKKVNLPDLMKKTFLQNKKYILIDKKKRNELLGNMFRKIEEANNAQAADVVEL